MYLCELLASNDIKGAYSMYVVSNRPSTVMHADVTDSLQAENENR